MSTVVLALLSALVLPGGEALGPIPVPMEMNPALLSGLIQLAVSLGGAGLLVQLLLLRANRRKIAGDASSSEANAASTLSGAALKMVENAQKAQVDAETKSLVKDEQIAALRKENEEQWNEINRARWKTHHAEMRTAILEQALAERGVSIPAPPPPTEHPLYPPPTVPELEELRDEPPPG